jgi:hypothetical protein
MLNYCMSERIIIICFNSVVGRVHFNPSNVYGTVVDWNTATVDTSEVRVDTRPLRQVVRLLPLVESEFGKVLFKQSNPAQGMDIAYCV